MLKRSVVLAQEGKIEIYYYSGYREAKIIDLDTAKANKYEYEFIDKRCKYDDKKVACAVFKDEDDNLYGVII